MLDDGVDEKLYEEFETFVIRQIKSGHDPIICAMIMLSLGLGTCKTILDKQEQQEILRMVKAFLDNSEEFKIPESITYH